MTDRREELRLERLLLSVALKDLHLFKFALEYDGDYKDLVEYVFHDIDDNTTFIHDLRQFENDEKSARSAFRLLLPRRHSDTLVRSSDGCWIMHSMQQLDPTPRKMVFLGEVVL